MATLAPDFVIAQPGALSVIDFYLTREGAEECLPQVQEQYAKEYPDLKVMAFDEYYALKRAKLLADPLVEITEEQWMYALEVLPPEQWHTDPQGVNKFLMCEHYTGTFTTQYARWKKRYFSRMVDAADRTTWITADSIAKAFP
jgi:hypothetical protein